MGAQRAVEVKDVCVMVVRGRWCGVVWWMEERGV